MNRIDKHKEMGIIDQFMGCCMYILRGKIIKNNQMGNIYSTVIGCFFLRKSSVKCRIDL